MLVMTEDRTKMTALDALTIVLLLVALYFIGDSVLDEFRRTMGGR